VADQPSVRTFRDDDLEPVLALLVASLGEPPGLRRTPELFAWKHFANPFGRSILLVAEVGARIAGLRAFMRWELVTPSGARFRCVRAVDTATHPDFQRMGIFRSLTLAGLEMARAEGVDLVFNTPNPRSGAGYLSMGWQPVGKIGVMIAPSLRMLRPADGARPQTDGDFLANSEPPGELGVQDRAPRGLRTPRTPEYLTWRFSHHPEAAYARVSAGENLAVVRPNLRRGRRELLVSDVFGPRPVKAIALARRRCRADYVAGWFARGSPERRAAMRAGLLPVPGVTSLTLMARPLRDLSVDVSSLSSWDLALSDLELL
jgi:GNAT superfamily N-acetyltransferase